MRKYKVFLATGDEVYIWADTVSISIGEGQVVFVFERSATGEEARRNVGAFVAENICGYVELEDKK